MNGLNSEDQQFPRVKDFYNGKTVFITGAAGFVGTVLLEVLLRIFPGIKAIYILLRPKKNVLPDARKEQILNKKIFEKIKEETPELLDKVHVIPGDTSLPNLGMSEDDTQLLIDEVSIVFHAAAIINFTRPLKFTLTHNVLGLDTIIQLCRRMRKFEAMIYTSTCFSNGNHTEILLTEEVFRLPFRAEKFLDALKNNDDERLEQLYSHCKPEWPNTYTFSKCLGENLIADTASDLPVAVIRPSICASCWNHPMPGYVEENSGIAALTMGVGKGFVKVCHAYLSSKLNFVPVDIVANTHILAAWSIATKRCMSPMIVNCTATENLDVPFSEYKEAMTSLIHTNPLPRAFAEYSGLIVLENKYLYYIFAAYHHYLPGIVLDGMLKLFGKKPKIYSLYRLLDKVMGCMTFFMSHIFEWERTNMEYLDKLIHPDERKDLSLDFRDCTLMDATMTLPHGCPFYDWKIDKKSPEERQKVIYRRRMAINCIQWTFMLILILLISWVYTLIFS